MTQHRGAARSAPPSRLREKQRLAVRAEILDSAAHLVAEHGADVTIRAVAERAQCSIGTVYRHFRSRGAILDAVQAEQVLGLRVRVVQELAGPSPAAATAVLRRLADEAAAHREVGQLVLDALTSRHPEGSERALTAAAVAALVDDVAAVLGPSGDPAAGPALAAVCAAALASGGGSVTSRIAHAVGGGGTS